MKNLASTKISQIVYVTDIEKGITTEYSYAKRASEAFNVSNFTIMNKLNGKNSKLYKGRYLIKGVESLFLMIR